MYRFCLYGVSLSGFQVRPRFLLVFRKPYSGEASPSAHTVEALVLWTAGLGWPWFLTHSDLYASSTLQLCTCQLYCSFLCSLPGGGGHEGLWASNWQLFVLPLAVKVHSWQVQWPACNPNTWEAQSVWGHPGLQESRTAIATQGEGGKKKSTQVTWNIVAHRSIVSGRLGLKTQFICTVKA